MSSLSAFHVEDQTDEDFFDNLVDDDFGREGSRPRSNGIVRDFSNLSLDDDIGTSVEDPDDAGLIFESYGLQQSETLQSSDSSKELLASVDCPPSDSSMDQVAPAGSSVVSAVVIEPQSSLPTQHSGSKGTSVKEVQWSAFSVSDQPFGNVRLESYSEFFTENVDSSSDRLISNSDLNLSPLGNQVENLDAHSNSLNFQDSQLFGSAPDDNTNIADAQYWESLYPGWKYDAATGQWYQLDGYDAGMNAQNHYDSSRVESLGDFKESAETTSFNSNVGSSDDLYHQQSSHPVLETIAEKSATATNATTTNSSVGYPENMEFPPNMVFDPQYPGWYYDTNTQQWYALESYATQIPTGVQNEVVASNGFSGENFHVYDQVGQPKQSSNGTPESQEFGQHWVPLSSSYSPQQSMLQAAQVGDKQEMQSFYNPSMPNGSHAAKNVGLQTFKPDVYHDFGSSNGTMIPYNSVNGECKYPNYSKNMPHSIQDNIPSSFLGNHNSVDYLQHSLQDTKAAYSQFAYSSDKGRSSAGRPAHALVAFGFGGKLLVVRNATSSSTNIDYGNQGTAAGVISILTLSEVVTNELDASSIGSGTGLDYFNSLCHHHFPGPLVGGSAFTKDINKWLDERISSYDAPVMEFQKGKLLKLLHSLLKISLQNYGKLRSPFGSDPSLEVFIICFISCYSYMIVSMIHKVEKNDTHIPATLKMLLLEQQRRWQSVYAFPDVDRIRNQSTNYSQPELLGMDVNGPEMEVCNLFASSKTKGAPFGGYDSSAYCLNTIPSESQLQTTAAMVQSLLVSGKRKEALQSAQEGQLWGPALVLAAQLGEKFYVDTVKKMAQHQFAFGSPLRSLCLLIAGQPADVFSAKNAVNTLPVPSPMQPTQVQPSGMLDKWEENLAIITANRTKDDELVIMHLGDCLWKDRGEVAAAHTCYLVAEANIESYNEIARLCLIGADHLKYPRTYATPDAIQRTELYEYSKVQGNSQFILQPFQPYKIIYAYMLAEVGKISDSLKYCQAASKLLKSSARTSELEMWKSLLSSLDDRLRTHQQGGYGSSLVPAKLVGKLFTTFDRSIYRMIGASPAPLSHVPSGNVDNKETYSNVPKVSNNQSTMVMASLVPSASVETMTEWSNDNDSKAIRHNRSVSEPDFGRTPKQDSSPDDPQSKATAGGSRFGRIGSQFLQKTMGWVSRSPHQAKLGESNKFYYDEKLKRWVEEGADPPADEPHLPPPPTTSFQNGMADYKISSAFKSDNTINDTFKTDSLADKGRLTDKHLAPLEQNSAIPPTPPSQNQFSARGRMGVRSRYVDTFNKGGGGGGANGASTNTFHSPTVPLAKPLIGANFFVPMAPATTDEKPTDAAGDNNRDVTTGEDPSEPANREASFSSLPSSASSSMQQLPSMNSNTPQNNNAHVYGSRAASWNGTYESFNETMAGARLGHGPTIFSPTHSKQSSSSLQQHDTSVGDDLQEIEL
ncbi:hypothetical protein ZIOFF_070332 [Zingiber officinale]|uniref:Protein transport protein sec16 n=1 Tax=Zingiber officinale TaxID=94328 RepID=A0A8J5CEV8_ZINOF|nr:hypothetical protein ZIOFF_070332 [Zingiber officinale]